MNPFVAYRAEVATCNTLKRFTSYIFFFSLESIGSGQVALLGIANLHILANVYLPTF